MPTTGLLDVSDYRCLMYFHGTGPGSRRPSELFIQGTPPFRIGMTHTHNYLLILEMIGNRHSFPLGRIILTERHPQPLPLFAVYLAPARVIDTTFQLDHLSRSPAPFLSGSLSFKTPPVSMIVVILGLKSGTVGSRDSHIKSLIIIDDMDQLNHCRPDSSSGFIWTTFFQRCPVHSLYFSFYRISHLICRASNYYSLQ